MGTRISVVIPAYNAGRYIFEAISSVYGQTLKPLEVIVIDDGSTDNTAKVVRGFQNVRYFHQENHGIASSRNCGVLNAQGDIIAFLDADDIWEPLKLEKQWDEMRKDPELDMVFGMVQQFISPELDEKSKEKIICPRQPMAGYHAGTMFIKKESFERAGLFSIEYRTGEFIEWFDRAKQIGLKFKMIPDIVMRRRLHDSNTMLKNSENNEDYIKILYESIRRRRTPGGEN